MKIEFFHDVICSFCFPMSYRMRQIKEKYPKIEIIHRSFALVPEVSAFDYMFGSREAAKNEILSHWEAANQNDDLHRFNIDGMREKDFLFPTSMPSLRAVKAVEMIGGNDLAWDAFDALQNAFFVQNKNIEERDVITKAIQTTGVDMEQWREVFDHEDSLKEVEKDLALSRAYGINGVPFVVVNGKYGLNGAQPLSQIEAMLNQIIEEEKQSPIQMMDSAGSSCEVDEEGKWNCD